MKRFFGFLVVLVVCSPPWGRAQEVLFSPGTFPVYSLVRPSTNQALVVGRNSRELYVVNLSEAAPTFGDGIPLYVDGDGNPFLDEEGRPIPVVSPLVVAVNEVTRKAVVVNYGSDNVSIVNLETQATEAVVPVGMPGAGPRGVAIDTENNIAIIALLNGNSVELLDLDTNTPALPAPIPSGPTPSASLTTRRTTLPWWRLTATPMCRWSDTTSNGISLPWWAESSWAAGPGKSLLAPNSNGLWLPLAPAGLWPCWIPPRPLPVCWAWWG